MSKQLEYPIKINIDSAAATKALRSLQTDMSKLTPKGTDELLININFDSSKTINEFKTMIGNIKSYLPQLTDEFDLNIFSGALSQYKERIRDLGYAIRDELDPSGFRNSFKELINDFNYKFKTGLFGGDLGAENTLDYINKIQDAYNKLMSLRMNQLINDDEFKNSAETLSNMLVSLEDISLIGDHLDFKQPLVYLQKNYKEVKILEDELKNIEVEFKNIFSISELDQYQNKIFELKKTLSNLNSQLVGDKSDLDYFRVNSETLEKIKQAKKDLTSIAKDIFTERGLEKYDINFEYMYEYQINKVFEKLKDRTELVDVYKRIQEAQQIVLDLQEKIQSAQSNNINPNGLFYLNEEGFERLVEILNTIIEQLNLFNTKIEENIGQPIKSALSLEVVSTWETTLLAAIGKIKTEISNIFGSRNTNIADTLFDWDFSNAYRRKKKLEVHEFSSAFNSNTGQVIGRSVYAGEGSSGAYKDLIEAAHELKVTVDTYAHSHPDSRVATLSLPYYEKRTDMSNELISGYAGSILSKALPSQEVLKGADLFSFFEKYKLGIDTEIVKALDEVFVFDSKSFFTDFADRFTSENIQSTKTALADAYKKYSSNMTMDKAQELYAEEFVKRYGINPLDDKKSFNDYVQKISQSKIMAEVFGKGFDLSKYSKTYTNEEFKQLEQFSGYDSNSIDHLYDILSKISQLDFSNLSNFKVAQDGLVSIANGLGNLNITSSGSTLSEIDALKNKFVELSMGVIDTQKRIQELNTLKENGTITQEQQTELDGQIQNLEYLQKQRESVQSMLEPYSNLKAAVSEFKEYLMEISYSLEKIQDSFALMSDGKNLSGLESSFSNLSDYISESAEAIKKMATATSNIKTDINLNFGSATKEESESYKNDAISTLESQIREIEGAFKKYTYDLDNYIVNAIRSTGLMSFDDFVKIDKNKSRQNINSLRDYADLLMQIAEIKGIDLSSIISGWDKMPDEVANFRKEINSADNAGSKLKQILSDLSNVDFGKLSSNIESINAILSDAYGIASEEQRAMLQKEEENFDPLKEKLSEVIKAIDAKTSAFVLEGETVANMITKECESFNLLIGKLKSVRDLVPSLSNIAPIKIEAASQTTSQSSTQNTQFSTGKNSTKQSILDQIKLLGLQNNKYVEQLGEVVKIEKSIRRTKDGLLESYKLTNAFGDSRTIGKNGDLVSSKTELFNIKGKENEIEELIKLQDELKSGGRLSDEMLSKINMLFDKIVEASTKASMSEWIQEFEAFKNEIGDTTDSYLKYARIVEKNNASIPGAKFAKFINNQVGIIDENQSAFNLSRGSAKNGFWTGALADESNAIISKYNDIIDILSRIKSAEIELSSMKNKLGGIQDQDILDNYNALIRETEDNLMSLRGEFRELNVSEFISSESNSSVLGEDRIQHIASMMRDVEKQRAESEIKVHQENQRQIDDIEKLRVKSEEFRKTQEQAWDVNQANAINKSQVEDWKSSLTIFTRLDSAVSKYISTLDQLNKGNYKAAATIDVIKQNIDELINEATTLSNKGILSNEQLETLLNLKDAGFIEGERRTEEYNQKIIDSIEERRAKTEALKKQQDELYAQNQAAATNKAQEEDWKSSLSIFDRLDAALTRYIYLSKQAFGGSGADGTSKSIIELNDIEQKISGIVAEAERLNSKGILPTDKFEQLRELIDATNKDVTQSYSQSISKYFDSMLTKSKEYLELMSKDSMGTLPESSRSRLNQLTEEFTLAQKLYDIYSSIDNISDQAKNSMENFASGLGKNYADSLDPFISKIETGISKLTNPKGYKYTEEYTNNLQQVVEKLNSLKDIRNGIITPEQVNLANQLKQEILDLFNNVNSNRNSDSFIIADPEKIRQSMLQIQNVLNKNTRMPNDLRELFNQLNQKYQIALDTGQTRGEVKVLNEELATLEYRLTATGKTGRSMWDRMTASLKAGNAQILRMYLSWFRIIGYVKQGFNVIKELDTALVDLRKTTSMNNEQLEKFYNNASNMAVQTGATTKEIISQAAAWSRLGYSSYEASTQMAQLSSQFAAISPGMDVDTATDGLVSSMKAFGIEVDDVERKVMDNINKIGNTMATTNEEIVDMLERSSSAMAAANNTIEETIALESAAVEITRNAESTGTAFRTISMRIRGYDEETEELSENLENISGKIADLTKVNGKGGVSLFTDETKETYKSTYQILKDISQVYGQLTDKNQAQLLEALGGKRGGQVIAAILNDFSSAEKALMAMEGAAGSADEEMGIIQDSIEYKLNALKETWVGFLQELIQRDDFADVIDTLTDSSDDFIKALDTLAPLIKLVVNLLSEVIEILGGVSSVFKGATPYVVGFSAAIVKGIKSGSIQSWVSGIRDAAEAEMEEAAASEAASAANIEQTTTIETKTIAKLKEAGVTEEEIAAHEAEALSEEIETSEKVKNTIATEVETVTEGEEVLAGQAQAATNLEEAASENIDTAATTKNTGATLKNMISENTSAVATSVSNGIRTLAGSFTALALSIGATTKAIALFLLTNPIGWIIDLVGAIFLAVKAYDKFTISVDEANEYLDDWNSQLEESKSKLKEQKDLVDEVKKSYSDLAKGVNTSTNENINLSSEDYEEFIRLNNELAEQFPELRNGLDDENNYIINLGDNASETAQKLDELITRQEKLRNMEISDNLPEVFKNTKVKLKDDDERIQTLTEERLVDYQNKIDAVVDGLNNVENYISDKDINLTNLTVDDEYLIAALNRAYNQLLSDINKTDTDRYIDLEQRNIFSQNDVDGDGYIDSVAGYFSQLNEEEISILKTYFEEYLGEMKGELQDIYDKYDFELDTRKIDKTSIWDSFINENLLPAMHGHTQYFRLSEVGQDMADALVGGLSSEVADQMDEKDPYEYIRNILYKKVKNENGEEVLLLDLLGEKKFDIGDDQVLFTDLFSGELSNDDLVELYNQIQNFFESNGIVLQFEVGEEAIEVDREFDTQNAELYNDDSYTVSEYNRQKIEEYTKGFTTEEKKKWIEITKGCKSADEATEKWEKHLEEVQDTTNKIKTNLDISGFSETMDKLESLRDIYENYKDNAENGLPLDLSDIEALRENFGDLDGFEELERLLSTYGSDSEEVQKAFDKLASQFAKTEIAIDDIDDSNKDLISSQLQLAGATKESADAFVDYYSNLNKLNSIGNIKDVVAELQNQFSEGGSVDLNVRPQIDSSKLEEAGWTDVGEGIATVFTNTISNTDFPDFFGEIAPEDTVAINFTPILPDGSVLTPEQLYDYAYDVLSGADDYLGLQIGVEYTGADAIDRAVEDAIKIHNLQDIFYAEDGQISLAVWSDIDALNSYAEQLNISSTALASFILQKEAVNLSNIETSEDVAGLLALATQAGSTADVLEDLSILMDLLGQKETAVQNYMKTGSMEYFYRAQGLNKAIDQQIIKIQNSINNQDPVDIPIVVDGSKTKDAASGSGSEDGDAYVEAYEKEVEKLDELKENNLITEKQYLEYLRGLYKKYFEGIEKYAEKFYEEQMAWLKKMAEYMESVGSAITTLLNARISAAERARDAETKAIDDQLDAIDDEIDRLNEEKDAAVDAIQKQIDAKQELIDKYQKQIDEMDKANEAREREINLQKALYELEKAQNQKTKLVYDKENGFTYQTDSDAVTEARKNVEDTKYEIEKAKIQDIIDKIQEEVDELEKQKEKIEEFYDAQIEALEKQRKELEKNKESIEDYWDAIIEGLEKQKSKWEELMEMREIAEAYDKVKAYFGDLGYTVQDVLSGAGFNQFASDYMSVLSDLGVSTEGLGWAWNNNADVFGTSIASIGSYLDQTKLSADKVATAIGAITTTLPEASNAAEQVASVFTTAFGTATDAVQGLNDALNGGDGGDTPDSTSDDSGHTMHHRKGKDDTGKTSSSIGGNGTIDTLVSIGEAADANIAGIAVEAMQELQDKGIETTTALIGDEESGFTGLDTKIKESVSDIGDEKTDGTLISGIYKLGETSSALEPLQEVIGEIASALSEAAASLNFILSKMGGLSFSGGGSSGGGGGHAFVNGNAFAWGQNNQIPTGKHSGDTLVGELGEELVVDSKTGTWRTVGTNGAEFADIDKNDIVFNHKQTAAILKNGHINSRGKAYSWGNVDGTLPNGMIPLSSADPEKYKILTSLNASAMDLSYGLNDVKKSIVDLNNSFMTSQVCATTNNSTPVINVNNPTFTCTGVTGEDVLHQIESQFTGLFVNAYQRSMIK